MLEDVEGRAEVPERGDDEGDVSRDPLQFREEGGGIIDMLDRVGTEGVLELIRGKGE